MISPPVILKTMAETAAVIHLTVPRSAMMQVFGPAVQELLGELERQGVAPTSAVFAHHLTMSAQTFDFELGVKVAHPVKASGRVRPGELPAARVAHTVYQGPYEGLHAAWAEFGAWIKTEGHAQADNLWEIYSTGPHVTPDPAQWRTELYRPLRD